MNDKNLLKILKSASGHDVKNLQSNAKEEIIKVNLVARERRNGLLIQSLMKLKINELLLKLF